MPEKALLLAINMYRLKHVLGWHDIRHLLQVLPLSLMDFVALASVLSGVTPGRCWPVCT